MPFFSIVVPNYNNEAYIAGCLDSLLNQDFDDYEVIVVDDCSTDGSQAIIESYTAKSDRIHLAPHEENRGPHPARKTGVEAARGEYVLFVDADDEMMPGALKEIYAYASQEQPDIIHFGMDIIVSDDFPAETKESFSQWANAPFRPLYGDDILIPVFSPTGGYTRDWRISQRAIKRDVIKEAFSKMSDDRLGRAQDGYEYFVVASIANMELTNNDIVLYKYFLGRGVTSTSLIDRNAFFGYISQYKNVYETTIKYAQSIASPRMLDCAQGFKAKLIEALANDWHERVADSDKLATIEDLTNVIGPDETACQLLRFVRDEAYSAFINEEAIDEGTPLLQWLSTAKRLANKLEKPSSRYYALLDIAEKHLGDAQRQGERIRKASSQRIKILAATHKDANTFDSDILQSMQIGTAIAPARLDTIWHDGTGANLSEFRPMYCELVAQYWAWKNLDADYFGLCHYRRYFNFTDTEYEQNEYGDVEERFMDEAAQIKYGLDDASIKAAIEGYDIVFAKNDDISSFPEGFESNYAQYEMSPHLHIEDFDTALAIVEEFHPEYAQDIHEFCNGHYASFCNMYVMKNEEFDAYCSWLFPILGKLTNLIDMSHYSEEGRRTPGEIGERLFNIYLQHQIRTRPDLKVKELQRVKFLDTERPFKHMRPMQESTQRNDVVPIVLAADDSYAPMVTTTLLSLLENASDDHYYDIVILSNDISYENQIIMRDFFTAFDNCALSFVNIAHRVTRYELTTNNAHINMETYDRFIIQDILENYDKVVYLDSDLIVKGDIAELFNTDVEGKCLAAVIDPDFLGNLNMKDSGRIEYAQDTLNMEQPYDYFQAGVLVLNLEELRKLHSVDEWLKIASNPDYIYNDQDVLNMECQGRVVYLNQSWNVMIDCFGRISKVISFAPADVYEGYMESRAHEDIVHYAGFEKPWNYAQCDRGELYWRYARRTPYYEELLYRLLSATDNSDPDLPERLISEESFVRRIADPLLPDGSLRREAVKKVGRIIKGDRG